MGISCWEQFAFSMFMGILQGLHVDPAKLPLLKHILVPIANSIMILYPDEFQPK
jgi:hypothetical protein